MVSIIRIKRAKFLSPNILITVVIILVDKLKPSHIPRRKSIRDEMRGVFHSVVRNTSGSTSQYLPEDRNVQRINLMINPGKIKCMHYMLKLRKALHKI